jgi:hypothetical protein
MENKEVDHSNNSCILDQPEMQDNFETFGALMAISNTDEKSDETKKQNMENSVMEEKSDETKKQNNQNKKSYISSKKRDSYYKILRPHLNKKFGDETKKLAFIKEVLNVRDMSTMGYNDLLEIDVGTWVVANPISIFGTCDDLIGRKCIYIRPESVLSDELKNANICPASINTYMGNVIDVKLFKNRKGQERSVLSQGIILSFADVKKVTGVDFENTACDTDITNLLRVIKYYDIDDPENPYVQYIRPNPGPADRNFMLQFPSFLKKTDQDNLYSYPYLLDAVLGRKLYAFLKTRRVILILLIYYVL